MEDLKRWRWGHSIRWSHPGPEGAGGVLAPFGRRACMERILLPSSRGVRPVHAAGAIALQFRK